MKTTIELSDAILQEARRLATREGISLRDLVEESLRKVIDERARIPNFKLRDASVDGEGLQPGVDPGTWEQVRDLIYKGHGA